MARTGKRWKLLISLVGAGLLWCGWRLWDIQSQRRIITDVEAAMRAGRTGLAARELTALLVARPDFDQAAYLLGVCENARRQPEAAFNAWERVSLDSPFAGLAIRGRMNLLIQQGRLADAEQLLEESSEDPRLEQFGISTLFALVLTQQGRFEEARRSIEDVWKRLNETGEGASEQAINLARMYIELDSDARLSGAVGVYFDQAGQRSPQDDRIWLGKANLAIRTGSFDQAARWLDACVRRRPNDVSVWRSWLRWALATSNLAKMREALTHLPAAESTSADVQRLAAWLAAHRGDPESEKRALERLITCDPADSHALDRLVELAIQENQTARVDALRRQKIEVERLQARYRLLYERNQPSRDAAEMARVAEQLGRWFEARVFIAVAVAEEPDRADLRSHLARLNHSLDTSAGRGRSLAEMLAPELGASARVGQRDKPHRASDDIRN
jgi:enediyne biosynthesis protein E4